MAVQDKNEFPIHQVENGLQHHQHTPRGPFLSGIKQRLLSFIFRGIWNEEADHALVGFEFSFPVTWNLFFFFFGVINHINFGHI